MEAEPFVDGADDYAELFPAKAAVTVSTAQKQPVADVLKKVAETVHSFS